MGSHSRLQGFLSLAAVALTVATIGLVPVATPAAADEATGSIVVTATAWAGGAPATTGCVKAYSAESTVAATQCANTGGVYTIDALAPGNYRLQFSGFTSVGPDQWYDRANSYGKAKGVTVAAGTPATVSYGLLPPSSVSGTVTNASGAPLAGTTVQTRWNADVFEQVVTDAAGRYVIQVDASVYRARWLDLLAPSGYASESWDDQLLGHLTALTFYSREAYMNTDAVLDTGGSISGLIAAPPGTLADHNGCVVAYSWDHQGEQVGRACGDVGTPFSIAHLHAGPYSLCILDNPAAAECSDYYDPWYGASYSSSGADTEPVVVQQGQDTAVDIRFGGVVKVTLDRDDGGRVLAGCLSSPELAAAGAVEDCAPVNGVFTFSVQRDLNSAFRFVLAGAAGVENRTYSSSTVELDAGRTVTIPLAVDSLGTGGVRVTISRDDSQSISQGCVDANLIVPGGSIRKRSTCSWDPDGVVEFTGLPAGDYTFGVRGVPGTYQYVGYPSAVGSEPLGIVHLADGQQLSLNVTLPTSLQISGKVVDPDGNPVADADVTFGGSAAPSASATTRVDGTYDLTVPVVSGLVHVAGVGALGAGWYSTGAPGTATYVQPSGRHVTNVNISLPLAARALGVLAAPPNKHWDTVCVAFMDPVNGAIAAHQCGSAGTPFAVGGLAPSSYTICVATPAALDSCAYLLLPDALKLGGGNYYHLVAGDNAVSLVYGGSLRVNLGTGSATPASGCAELTVAGATVATSCELVGGHIDLAVAYDVGAGVGTVRVFDVEGFVATSGYAPAVRGGWSSAMTITMSPWRSVQGTITRPAGFANTHACALVTNLATVFEESCVDPGVSTYSLQVPPGDYFVAFYTMEPGVSFEWYNDKPTLAGAQLVSVTGYSGAVANAALVPSGRIGGTVLLSDGTAATQGCVTAYAADGYGVQSDCVDGDGHYALEGLPGGVYSVEFYDFPDHASMWFNGADTYSAATAVKVVAGTTTTVNQTLALGARLQGTVTFDGQPATGGCVTVVNLAGDSVAEDCAIDDGTYVVDGVPVGTFTVLFSEFDGAADVWNGPSATFEGAQKVTFTAGQQATLDAQLSRGGSIAGRGGNFDTSTKHTYVVSLYEPDGAFIASVTPTMDPLTGDLSYLFDHLPQGNYMLAISRDGETYDRYYFAAGDIARSTIAIPTGTSWDVSGIDVGVGGGFGTYEDQAGAIAGWLNVPSQWTSSTVCAVAVTLAGVPTSASCGHKGDYFELPRLQTGVGYRIVFTNGEVRTRAQFAAFPGARIYYGNTSVPSTAPAYLAPVHSVAQLPVWFFRDVSYKTPSFQAIQWMADYGFSTGYSDGTYRPAALVMRRDLATYLYKLAGSPKVTLPAKSPFTDVKAGATGYTAMVWMYQRSLWTSTTFGPTKAVTRASLALILYRMAGRPAVALPSKSPYTDVGKSTSITYKAIIWARTTGVMGAASGKQYKPNAYASRGLLAAGMYQWWRRYG